VLLYNPCDIIHQHTVREKLLTFCVLG